MPDDLEGAPDRAAALCREAQHRLLGAVSGLDDDRVAVPSLLEDWTVGHVLTHLARNADGHSRRLAGALVGQDRPKYEGGAAQRTRDIDEGAARPAEVIVEDLRTSQERLESLFDESAAAGWPNPQFRGGSDYGPRGCPAHRLREVEMHHVDLGIGYLPSDWPEAYVAWDLPVLLSTAPARIESLDQRRALMAWLAGRGPLPTDTSLTAWG